MSGPPDDVVFIAVQREVVKLLEGKGAELQLNPPVGLTPATRLFDEGSGGEGTALGLDSLDTVSLIAALEEEFACAVPPEVDMGRIRTLQDVVDAIVLATRPKETASLGEKPRDVDVAARD